MPILLDTPFTFPVAHGEPDEVCPMVQMVLFAVKPVDATTILEMAYGNVVNGEWMNGKAEHKRFVLRDSAEVQGHAVNPETGQTEAGVVKAAVTDFTEIKEALLIKLADDGIEYYEALSRDLYQWLIDKGHYSGTIV